MKLMTIGQVSKRSGFGVETIRFYERSGLIEEPSRRPSGYRQYPEAVLARLEFIRAAKELGFKLKEVEELLSLRVDPGATCGDVRRRADAKITEIEAKIRTLGRIRKTLLKITAVCDVRKPIGECPILESLDHDAQANLGPLGQA